MSSPFPSTYQRCGASDELDLNHKMAGAPNRSGIQEGKDQISVMFGIVLSTRTEMAWLSPGYM